jgi:chemotaxis protein histidine kinase CheA
MILDVAGIAADADLRFHDARAAERAEQAVGETENRREFILFANAKDERFAVDLSQIVRLERIEPAEIERIGASEYLQHLGRGLPLIRLEHHLPVSPIAGDASELFVLIPKSATATPAGGILASSVIDTIDAVVSLDRRDSDVPAVSGRAVLQGKLTTFLDAERLLEVATLGAQA